LSTFIWDIINLEINFSTLSLTVKWDNPFFFAANERESTQIARNRTAITDSSLFHCVQGTLKNTIFANGNVSIINWLEPPDWWKHLFFKALFICVHLR